MPFKQWGDGEVIFAADANRFLLQQDWIRKIADESVLNSITLQDDDHLVLPLLANTQYWFETFLIYDGATATGELRINWSLPSGASVQWTHGGLRGASTSTVDEVSRTFLTTGDGLIGSIDGATAVVVGEGRVTTGGTAGNMRLRWAQASLNNTTATRVLTGSALIITRLTT